MLIFDQWWYAAIAFGAALGGGAMNALAGGGTVLTFPILVAIGLPPVKANVTNAVSLWPGSIGGAWGFRKDIAAAERWWFWLMVPGIIGGVGGAFLLLSLPARTFITIAPYLVLAATALIAVQRPVEKLLHVGQSKGASVPRRIGALVGEFFVALFGGYFGAGLGILVLTTLSLGGVKDIHQANGLKNLIQLAIKGAAVIYFIVTASVAWEIALLMIVGTVIGGYAGGVVGHRVDERLLRWIVVLIGVGMAVVLFLRLGTA